MSPGSQCGHRLCQGGGRRLEVPGLVQGGHQHPARSGGVSNGWATGFVWEWSHVQRAGDPSNHHLHGLRRTRLMLGGGRRVSTLEYLAVASRMEWCFRTCATTLSSSRSPSSYCGGGEEGGGAMLEVYREAVFSKRWGAPGTGLREEGRPGATLAASCARRDSPRPSGTAPDNPPPHLQGTIPSRGRGPAAGAPRARPRPPRRPPPAARAHRRPGPGRPRRWRPGARAGGAPPPSAL